ncbi:TetR/AcrR family transcriptional regulator [Cystobacter fuscus]
MASKRSDAKQNREHLLAVARALAKNGEVPSFNELAKKAEVGVGTVYRHFADQQALLAGMVEEQLEDFRALIEHAVENEDVTAALEALFRGAVELVVHRPLVAKVLAGSEDEFRSMEAKVEAVVARAKKAKVIRPDVGVSDFRRLVCGIELAARVGPQPRAAAQRYVEIVLAGIRP